MEIGIKTIVKRSFRNSKENGLAVIFLLNIAVFMLGASFVPYFFKGSFWSGVFMTYTPVTLMSIGLAVVLIGGAIDLSVGSTASLSCVLLVYSHNVMGLDLYLSLFIAMACGLLFGAFKGIVIVKLRLNPFITTFAFSLIAEGTGHWIIPDTHKVGGAHDFTAAYAKSFFGLPFPIWFIIAGLLIWLIIQNTSVGLHIFALGNDPFRGYSTGINCEKTSIVSYVFCGFMSGLAGIAITGLISVGSYSYGTALNLQAIAACIVGGVVLEGGGGSVLGAVFGALFLGMLSQVVMAIIKNPYLQPIVAYSLVFLCIIIPSMIKAVRKKGI